MPVLFQKSSQRGTQDTDHCEGQRAENKLNRIHRDYGTFDLNRLRWDTTLKKRKAGKWQGRGTGLGKQRAGPRLTTEEGTGGGLYGAGVLGGGRMSLGWVCVQVCRVLVCAHVEVCTGVLHIQGDHLLRCW